MERPWLAEHEVSAELARELLAERFPALQVDSLELLGVGWDNTAWLVGGELVVRFPRRPIAVPLIETEARLLPWLASRLPLPVPVPELVAAARPADERYPWPFAGYRRLAGSPAADLDLDGSARLRAAVPLARFLAALHAAPVEEARALGAPGDELGRLDLAKRLPLVEERLALAVRRGLLASAAPFEPVLAATPRERAPGGPCVVHGDLYARHVLVDREGTPTGVIDWGDVHLGDPALDLSLAHSFLPPAAHEAFRAAYGPIDEPTWRMARFRALHYAAILLVYGADTEDAALVREARRMLAFVASD